MQNKIKQIKSEIQNCLQKDQHRFSQTLRKNLLDDQLLQLQQQVSHSAQLRQTRLAAIPAIVYPDLPITQQIEAIQEQIEKHQVVVLVGETGSGKSTQLPKICLQMGLGAGGWIGHTQPRRIAARSVAARIAEELGSKLGKDVGYQVRFDKTTDKASYLKLMTDGILLQEIKTDPYLSNYEVLIVDEAHERSINIDLILGHIKRILPQRKNLKIIITSATIDHERLAKYFYDAPVVQVEGQTHPIELIYDPVGDVEIENALEAKITENIKDILTSPRGDILVFLPTEYHISRAYRYIKGEIRDIEILPLYSRLKTSEQDRIFKKTSKAIRIILSTNIAETSLTVPNIHYVIDSGLVRINRYNAKQKVTMLPVEMVSQSSANQRKGRCGRLAAGRCIRLYSESQFQTMDEFTDPEIKRCNLANVILQLAANKLGDIRKFPFLLPPEANLVSDGINLLKGLNALDAEERITSIGRKMARYPLEPRFSRMLIEASRRACLKEVMIIISCLNNRVPELAKLKNRKSTSEFLSILELWGQIRDLQKHGSRKQLHEFYQSMGISYGLVSEWLEIYSTLVKLGQSMGMQINRQSASEEQVLKSILSGLVSNIGYKIDKFRYKGARSSEFFLHPSSIIQPPPWVVAVELVKTSKLYGRVVSRIDPKWIVEFAPHLVKRQYSKAYWDKNTQRVCASESGLVYGLVIYKGKKVNFGKLFPDEARSIFIEQALLPCELNSQEMLYVENCKVLKKYRDLMNKLRHAGDSRDQEILDYYYKLLPSTVCDKKSYEDWSKGKQLKPINLAHDINKWRETERLFPDEIKIDEDAFQVSYLYQPGDSNDGVKISLSVMQLAQFNEGSTLKQMPGLLREQIKYYLQGLPKKIRKHFIPLAESADRITDAFILSDAYILDYLAEVVLASTGDDVNEDLLRVILPDAMRICYQIVDENGQIIGTNRDLSQLSKSFASETDKVLAEIDWGVDTKIVRSWQFGEIAPCLERMHGGQKITGYPAICRADKGVKLEVLLNKKDAEAEGLLGLMALVKIQTNGQARQMKKDLHFDNHSLLAIQKIYDEETLKSEIVDRVYSLIFAISRLIYHEQEFNDWLVLNCKKLLPFFQEFKSLFIELLNLYSKILQKIPDYPQEESVYDVKDQLDRLIHRGFVGNLELQSLKDYIRFMNGIMYRIDRWQNGMQKDLNKLLPFRGIWLQFWGGPGRIHPERDEVKNFRWELEELRLNIFSPEIGSKYPVSVHKLSEKLSSLCGQ